MTTALLVFSVQWDTPASSSNMPADVRQAVGTSAGASKCSCHRVYMPSPQSRPAQLQQNWNNALIEVSYYSAHVCIRSKVRGLPSYARGWLANLESIPLVVLAITLASEWQQSSVLLCRV
jgi:hypothetical protein